MASTQSTITRIREYTFGRLTAGSRTYSSDVIIWPDRVRDRWWRREGHSLCLDDLKEVLADPPKRLLLGQGHTGLMKVPAEVKTALVEQGIEVFVMPTAEAAKTWNRWLDEEGLNLNAVAAFHLTC